VAQREGHLQRNFQGYSTFRQCDLIGLGVSAIGKIGDCYAQNQKEIPTWESTVAEGRLPIWRGVCLTVEDRLRRGIIESIMCHGRIQFGEYEERFGIDFKDHYAAELEHLEHLADDGLLVMNEDGFEVTAAGRLLVRAIAMIFDEYLQPAKSAPRFSRVI
jgi:oxygen-independent coproporphyrinogen-3 oxidase